MRILILVLAILPFVAGLIWAWWADPYRRDRARARRALAADRWQKWQWPS